MFMIFNSYLRFPLFLLHVYMLGANLGLLLYGEVSVIKRHDFAIRKCAVFMDINA